MNKQDRTIQVAYVSATLLLAFTLSVACGGSSGSGGGTTPVGRTATFAASNPSPGPEPTISLGPGAASGDTFQVVVSVAGVDDLFGAAFRITFSPTIATFTGTTTTGSILLGTGVATDFTTMIDPGDSGQLLVTATRLQGGGGTYVPSVDATQNSTLVTLNFRATTTTTSTAYSFGGSTTRTVTSCDDVSETCSDLVDGDITWSGGTLAVR